MIPKAGQPGKTSAARHSPIYDRVCQQALVNRLEPIFEPVFDRCQLRIPERCKIDQGCAAKGLEGARSRDRVDRGRGFKRFFRVGGSRKAYDPRGQQNSRWPGAAGSLSSMLKAGCYAEGPDGSRPSKEPRKVGVISPLLSNILLTPFDREMRTKGYRLTQICR